MPNHVTNYLLVEGDQTEINRFFEQAKGENGAFDFNSFVPMPSTVFKGDLGEKEERKYPGDRNWHGWSLNHWGTKWNAYSIEISSPLAQFDTAWSVPEPFLVEMSKKFPSLTFTNEWVEETLESAGIFVVKDGEVEERGYETGSTWGKKESNYLHPLNLKYDREHYLGILEECVKDDDDVYSYYLKLAKEVQA